MKTKISNIIFSFLLLVFFNAFDFQHNQPEGWYQQFMPDLSGRRITDMTFLDSLTGYAVTYNLSPNDTGYILKTTDGGDNWFYSFSTSRGFTSIQFVNSQIGYACGGNGGWAYLCKTIDSGLNWNIVNTPANGGISWQRQYSAGSNNPNKIYFYDANIGFINAGGNLYRTSNGGGTWTHIPSFGGGFYDIIFIDSLTGWKTTLNTSVISKTTDGGLNWFLQGLPPQSGFFAYSVIGKFALINKDTVWGGYPFANFNNQYLKGILYITSDGGENWNYQVPELTTMGNVPSYRHLYFINKDIGWAYHLNAKGVHTVTGGDTTFLSLVEQISSLVPEKFNLYQNYPNPFNPTTKIRFDISKTGEVKLVVHDILGREISVLVNERLSPGIYEYTFEAGSGLASGVYFYTLQTEKASVTKRMVFNK
ncbi:T9SS type A sorting domain-containing protein [Ignavibacteria bacterium CHB1]|nr:T9SS type A sorting domain-containing protein [Ignavibacteria bacterium CHB1]